MRNKNLLIEFRTIKNVALGNKKPSSQLGVLHTLQTPRDAAPPPTMTSWIRVIFLFIYLTSKHFV